MENSEILNPIPARREWAELVQRVKKHSAEFRFCCAVESLTGQV